MQNMDTEAETFLKIRVQVTDINDNCPTLNVTDVHLPLIHPTASSVPMLALKGTDLDSSLLNAQINFATTEAVLR